MKETFSRNEQKIISLVGKRKIKIADLTKKFYGRRVPINGANVMASTVRRITRKCSDHRLPWTIAGEGLGRSGRTIWKQETKGKKRGTQHTQRH